MSTTTPKPDGHRCGGAHADAVANAHWLDRPEAGSRFAMWLFRCVGLRCGRRFARLFLYPLTLYFYCRRGPERRAARDYFRRLDGTRGSALPALRLMHTFSATTLDRMFLLTRGMHGFRITQHGTEGLDCHLEHGRGAVLLGAHVGSFDVLRLLATERPQYQLKLVMDRSKTPALTGLLEELAPELTTSIIDAARSSVDVVLALSEAVNQGAMVALLGDRGRTHESMREVPFLGAPAAFPTAAWQIAALFQIPVVLCLGLYRGGNRYDLVFETLAERVALPRAGRAAALDKYIGLYAARLEHYLHEAPYNWFNFHDFWEPQPVSAARSAAQDDRRQARAA